jgi:predicted amidophosphoribosyltransferase
MPTCPKCGAEAEKDEKFCRFCGTRLAAETGEPIEKESSAQEREVCFGEGERHRDYSGLVSFGVFLLKGESPP